MILRSIEGEFKLYLLPLLQWAYLLKKLNKLIIDL